MPRTSTRARKYVVITDEIRSSKPQSRNVAEGTSAAQGALDGLLDDSRTESAFESVQPSPIAEHVSMPFVAPAVGRLRPRTPVVSGYDRLDHSIASLVDRLPAAPLQDKFNVIAQWIERFNVDVVPARTEKLLESILDAADQQAETREHSVLSHLKVLSSSGPLCARAMAGAFSAHQLLLLLGKMHPNLGCISQRTLRALMEAIYVSPPAAVPTSLVDSHADSASVRDHMIPFKGRMHFQANKETARRLTSLEKFVFSQDSSAARQKRVLQKAVRAWQSSSVRLTLRAWKKVVDDEKSARAHREELRVSSLRHSELSSELDSAKAQILALEEKLRSANATITQLNSQLKSAAARHQHEEHALEKAIASRDYLIEDLEAKVEEKEREARRSLDEAFAKYRDFGNTVASFIHDQAEATGVGVLDAPRRIVMKVVGEAGRLGGASENVVISWVRKVLQIVDPEETVVRPESLIASPQCFTCFAELASRLFPHLQDDNETMLRGLEASSLSLKAKAIVTWVRATQFPMPDSLEVSTLLNNSREGANTTAGLYRSMMSAVARPFECFPNAVPTNREETVPVQLPSSAEEPLDATAVCTRIRQFVQELQGGGKCAIDLLRDSWSSTADALHSVIAGSSAVVALTTDEANDRGAFELNHQLIADVSHRDEVAELQEIVDSRFRELRKIFLFYAGDSGTVTAQTATVAPADLHRLVVDTQLAMPGVVDRETIADDFAVNALDSRRFVAALIRIARRRLPSEESVAASLKVLLESHLLAFAEVPDDTMMPRAAVDDAPLARLLSEFRNDIFKVFRAYCKDPDSANKLGADHYLAVLRDSGLIGSDLSETNALRVFHKSKATVASTGLNFDSFLSALFWISAFLLKDPFQRPATKIKQIVFGRFLPAFRTKYKLSAPSFE